MSSMSGHFTPELPKYGKNTMNIEILAIRWRLIGEILFQFAKIGIKIIER